MIKHRKKSSKTTNGKSANFYLFSQKMNDIFSMIYLFLSKIMLLQTKVFPKTHL